MTKTALTAIALAALATLTMPAAHASDWDRVLGNAERIVDGLVPVSAEETYCSATGFVCATAQAHAMATTCVDAAPPHTLFPCTYGRGDGEHYGQLGLVSGSLTGHANTVPLSDHCGPTRVEEQHCYTSSVAERYPGFSPQPYWNVATTTPYGEAAATASAHDTYGI